ncbi:hypothetical protein C8Q77DRAFT_1071885 [Trametes polyzona]|nr:hypothetical protein C8Q77DRAFT_1071885 [Trametes polyzona]
MTTQTSENRARRASCPPFTIIPEHSCEASTPSEREVVAETSLRPPRSPPFQLHRQQGVRSMYEELELWDMDPHLKGAARERALGAWMVEYTIERVVVAETGFIESVAIPPDLSPSSAYAYTPALRPFRGPRDKYPLHV